MRKLGSGQPSRGRLLIPSPPWLLVIGCLLAATALRGDQAASAQVVVSISPSSATVHTTQLVQFIAKVTGNVETGLIWSVNSIPGGSATIGRVSATGLYKAPAHPPVPATVTVTATSVADRTKSASAKVTVLERGESPIPGLPSPWEEAPPVGPGEVEGVEPGQLVPQPQEFQVQTSSPAEEFPSVINVVTKQCSDECLRGKALSAEAVLEQMHEGHAPYVCVGCPGVKTVVHGSLFVREKGLTLGDVVFQDAELPDGVGFDGTTFKGHFLLLRCTVGPEGLYARDSRFERGLTVRDVTLRPRAFLQFEEDSFAYLEASNVLALPGPPEGPVTTPTLLISGRLSVGPAGKVWLDGLRMPEVALAGDIQGAITVYGAEVGEIMVGPGHFSGRLAASRVSSAGGVTLDQVALDGGAALEDSTIEGPLYISRLTSKGTVTLRRLRGLPAEVRVESAELSGPMEIDQVRSAGNFVLRNVVFGRDLKISNSYIRRVDLDPDHRSVSFKPGAAARLSDFEFGKLLAHWSLLSEPGQVSPDVLPGLEENYYHRLRWLTDGDGVYVQLKQRDESEAKREQEWGVWALLWFFWLISRYGVDPLRVLGISLGFVLFFALLYALFEPSQQRPMLALRSLPGRIRWTVASLRHPHTFLRAAWARLRKGYKALCPALRLSFNVFLPGPFLPRRPLQAGAQRNCAGVEGWQHSAIALIEKGLGWLLLTFFIVTLTHWLIR